MSNMNQPPMGQVPGPYPPPPNPNAPYQNPMMQQRPPMHQQGMQWAQQPGGVPPRYGMAPGQMGPSQLGPGQMPPGQMGPGQMSSSQMSGAPMGSGQMPPGQMPGQMAPGQMPGQMAPGQMQPGQIPGQMPPGQMPGQMGGQMGPGQMVHVYPGQQGQPQTGTTASQMQPQGGPQMYPRPPMPQGSAMIRGPNQYPGQPPMSMSQMPQGAYGAPPGARMMMPPGQGMPPQQHPVGTPPVMQSQYMPPGAAHPPGSQPQQPPSGQYAPHNYAASAPVDPGSVDRNRVRSIAPMPPGPHMPHGHPGGMGPQQSVPPTQMGPPGPPPQPHPPMPVQPPQMGVVAHGKVSKKKKRLSDKLLTDRIQEIVPESQAYMELLQFEKKIDETIQRKRLEVQEVLKKPLKLRKKLRIFINSSFFPANVDSEDPDARTPSWELRVEGRLLDDPSTGKVADPAKFRRKFSSFFKSLVIELDKNIYGPENYLVEWHRTATTQETDGFQVKRPGEQNVVCKLHFMLDYQPPQFKLDGRLARLLGIHTQTRAAIIMALWQYIRTHRLQDPHERDVVICDSYLKQIFEVERIRFPDIPQIITGLLLPPEPIIVQHVVAVGPGEGQTDARRTSCYDIEVEVDDPLIGSMHQFIYNLQAQQEIAQLDSKIVETVELINKSKTAREFYMGFGNDPQQFIDKWLASQCADLKTMTDCEGNPEYDRRSTAFTSEDPSTREAVMRYFFNRVHLRRAELEQALMNGGK